MGGGDGETGPGRPENRPSHVRDAERLALTPERFTAICSA